MLKRSNKSISFSGADSAVEYTVYANLAQNMHSSGLVSHKNFLMFLSSNY